jgi:putative SOS response-associated peptidase YedK
MCGRFTFGVDANTIAAEFNAKKLVELQPNYNAAPSQNIPVVRQNGERVLEAYRWGLIPSWSTHMRIAPINARAETLLEKPMFKKILQQRCLIPADGFYEWKAGTPHYFHLKKRKLFAFAGLWDQWNSPNGPVKSCLIITTAPNATVRKVHDRMPAILSKKDEEAWLTAIHPAELLSPIQEDMVAYPVSKAMNSAKNNGPECRQAIGGKQ